MGTYDKKVQWFDLDLSTMPYQVLRYHVTAVRGVAYHKRYPLFASGSDDTSIIVSHGMVYNDLLQNPLIVPVKQLRYIIEDFTNSTRSGHTLILETGHTSLNLVTPSAHRGHTRYDDFGVMEVMWHPTQPWLFSAGADGFIKLWT